MKDTKRHATKYVGVTYRLVERIGGSGTEKMFYVRFKKDGKLYEEKAGRQFADQDERSQSRPDTGRPYRGAPEDPQGTARGSQGQRSAMDRQQDMGNLQGAADRQ